MAQLFIQAQKFTLAGSGVTATATSIELSSFNMPNGDAIVSADLGTTNYGTLEPGTSREEIISFTGITSTTLTGVTRGLDFASPYTTIAGNKKAHAGGTVFVLTNNPQVYQDFASVSNDEVVTGDWTFPAAKPPKLSSYAAPVDDEDLSAKKFVVDTATGTTSINRITVAGNAGETVVAGEFVYQKLSDGEWYKTDASAASTCENVLLGIAQGVGTDGVAIAGGVLIRGTDSNQAGLTANTDYFLSDTAGDIATTAGTVEVEVGFSHPTDATKFIFSSRFDKFLTEDQQDALAGSSGTPSATNKFITADDVKAAATASKIPRADASNKIAEGYLNITDVNAATLTDGSDADSLHTHGAFGTTSKMVGAGEATTVKTYWNFTLPYLISTNVPSGDFWTAVGATQTSTISAIRHTASADAVNSLITTYGIFTDETVAGANSYIQFDQTKKVIVEFGLACLASDGSEQMGWGLANTVAPFSDFDDTTVDAACFTTDTAGKLYAHTSNAGVASTETEITGITLTNYNTFRIEFDPGVDVKFYVNGTLKDTATTNLPDGAADIKFGFGSGGNTNNVYPFFITEPAFSVEK